MDSDKDNMQEDCYLCGKMCAPKGLKAHIRSHTNITIYDCNECGHRFSTKKLLLQHKITHSTHYLCEECNGKYKDTECLKKHKCIPVMEQRECHYCGKHCAPKGLVPHIRSHKNHKNYACEECEEKFSSKKKLKKHKVSHRATYRCYDCDGNFRDPDRLKTHTCIYGKEKSHFCDLCDKGFFSKYDLGRHMIIHTGQKPYECDICFKQFNQKSNRDTHLKTHDTPDQPKRERKFVCEICFHAFGYKQHLKRHMLIHYNEKPYGCDICHKRFSQKSYLKIHAAIHTNQKPYKCDQCEKSFNCKWKLSQHEKRHGPPTILCPTCDRGFYSSSDYDRHLITHTKTKPYICDVCHKGFSARFTLQNHYNIHVGNPTNKRRRVKIKEVDNIGQDYTAEESNCSLSSNLINISNESNCITNEINNGQLTGQEYVLEETSSNLEAQEYFEVQMADFDNLNLDEQTYYLCLVCQGLFQSEKDLENHTNEFVQEDLFVCCSCGKKCNEKEDLLDHHKVHSISLTDKPFVSFIVGDD